MYQHLSLKFIAITEWGWSIVGDCCVKSNKGCAKEM